MSAPSGTDLTTTAPSSDRRRRVAVFTHTRRAEAIDAARRLIGDLAAAGIVAVVPDDELEALRNGFAETAIESLPEASSPGHCELVVVLGGDGTILRGAEWALASDIPLLGVNLGHVGFLAEAESSQVDEIASHVVAGDYRVEERLTVEVAVTVAGERVWESFAINEVSIEKAARERMIDVMVGVDAEPLSRWGCDGVLVSTPTGSTAYAFSAGGPVISPTIDALLLLPLSAHALFARPMVLAPQQQVDIELVDSEINHGVVWCDGRRSLTLAPGSVVTVTRGAHRLRLARLSTHSFTERLVRKFGLRVEGWRNPATPRTDSA